MSIKKFYEVRIQHSYGFWYPLRANLCEFHESVIVIDADNHENALIKAIMQLMNDTNSSFSQFRRKYAKKDYCYFTTLIYDENAKEIRIGIEKTRHHKNFEYHQTERYSFYARETF